MFNPVKKTSAAAAHHRIDGLCDEGEALLGQGTREARQVAYSRFIEALELIPAPHHDEPRAARLYCGLGDVYFQSADFETARDADTDAVRCRNGLGDAQVHVRLGKAQFELGELERAADERCRAYSRQRARDARHGRL